MSTPAAAVSMATASAAGQIPIIHTLLTALLAVTATAAAVLAAAMAATVVAVLAALATAVAFILATASAAGTVTAVVVTAVAVTLATAALATDPGVQGGLLGSALLRTRVAKSGRARACVEALRKRSWV
ncbi:hypothetical protein GGR56DRAFT_634359, partial [Xylariaceae sp. FL0804]